MIILENEKSFINKKITKKSLFKNKIISFPKKILVMGLPGSGKTFLSKELNKIIPIIHLNADEIRKHFNDWDFSKEGRLRQADRMKRFSDYIYLEKISPLADFVCPLDETRKILNPDIIIWMDTEKKGRYEDTNKIFQKPKKFHFRITSKNAKYWASFIKERIINNDY
ncbi:MAG: hypothetical protein CFH26_00616 [Alphaproteobacteria bacterium MarineAlpha6_Bin4]|nr:MAG: hypothetical protein CFH25_00652 [Alphaproteobacteria bacterium MarineAlpha6_Bin3]PPR37681.1 MAG: hypothetical protein CFH26_00616 [Alphaproteobacteria bacterium MarineAlpha6_Bin4]|tara:strand:- start:7393 stop:7896 length:504 start_codon:yes stop_codon:yes gene_type:complete